MSENFDDISLLNPEFIGTRNTDRQTDGERDGLIGISSGNKT